MSFLDNLENSLNQLERGNDKEAEREDRKRREAELAAERSIAPRAEQLKKSPFTNALLTECMTIGHKQRTRVGMAWIGTTLRLDAKEKRLELRPTAEGILAVFHIDGAETSREPVDLNANAAALAAKWLAVK
ncbi:MAG: hypothetical protein FJW38_14130 [Acidobacteria bacterium]|nr:hypothetical protein [Acidobacteriota bacterium]